MLSEKKPRKQTLRDPVFLFASAYNFTGIPIIQYIFNHFNEKGETISFHCDVESYSNFFQHSNSHLSLIKFKDYKALNSQSFFQKSRKYLWALAFLSRILISKRKHKTIIYTIDWFILSLGLLLKNRFPIKIIYHQIELFEPSRANKIDQFLFKYAGKKADRIDLIIMPEKNRLNYFKEVFPVNAKTRTLIMPNSNNNQTTLEHKAPSQGKTVIGHIGNVGMDHYIKGFLEAIKSLPQDKFEIQFIGFLKEEVLDLIRSYELNNIKIIGQIPHKELDKYYRKIDIGVILYKDVSLNHRFCAPNKLYEYWSYGIPVVAHPLPGLTPLFDHKCLGRLIDMENTQRVVNAIHEIKESNNETSKLQLINYFKKNYHISQYLNQLEQMLIQE
jgi:glycosyltransferase involved in cell wall biosynthesis